MAAASQAESELDVDVGLSVEFPFMVVEMFCVVWGYCVDMAKEFC